MKKVIKLLSSLTLFERVLWGSSVLTVTLCYIFSQQGETMNFIASLIGVSALIFVAKGYVVGQALLVVFSVFYGIISFNFGYYGEMITYLGMSAPIAVLAMVEWIKYPYKKTSEVAVSALDRKKISVILVTAVAVTVAFYFLLKALKNENLIFSTISVTTSFVAAFLTALRSPYYALGYALNDIVLIILWISASMKDLSYVTMVICFSVFLVNDVYGFVSWQRMKQRQNS